MIKSMNKAEFFRSLINELSDKGLVKNRSDLADKLGISRSSISDLISGRSNLSLDRMIKITELFNVQFIFLNGTINFVFPDDSEKVDPLFQDSINYLKHLAHTKPDKTTQFVKSLKDLLKDNNT